jgi:hypothetical protein
MQAATSRASALVGRSSAVTATSCQTLHRDASSHVLGQAAESQLSLDLTNTRRSARLAWRGTSYRPRGVKVGRPQQKWRPATLATRRIRTRASQRRSGRALRSLCPDTASSCLHRALGSTLDLAWWGRRSRTWGRQNTDANAKSGPFVPAPIGTRPWERWPGRDSS